MDITELLVFAQKNNASDLHLSANNPPLLRVHGDILPLKMAPLSVPEVRELIYAVMNESQRARFEEDYELDFAFSIGEGMRYRVNAFHNLNGPAAALRSIPTRIQTMEEIGAPVEVLTRLAELTRGLVLVTGPTGSGKSTTLASIIHYINSRDRKHILTIEDPVEFVHESKMSLVNQRDVGVSTRSFARALKSALREDPDVILVGELRDIETMQLALTAAETGHLVLGTLHTSSAAKTIDRIIDVFPADTKEMIRAMLSVSLEGVISQRLLKRVDGQGRVAVHEILLGTPAVRNLIREGKIPQIESMMQTGMRVGMQTMKDAAFRLLQEGRVTEEEVRRLLRTGADAENEDANSAATMTGSGHHGTGRPAAVVGGRGVGARDHGF